MAFPKIEPSGCCIRNGWIQLRLCFYLEPLDQRYSEHHAYVVDTTSPQWLSGYHGMTDSMGNPMSQADYASWVASLPRIWQDNPFHNHFVFVDITDTDISIRREIQKAFHRFLAGWIAGKDMGDVWRSKERPQFAAKNLTPEQLLLANARLEQIKAMVI